MIIGITGKIGSGKSFLASFFKNKKIVVFDADKEILNLYNNNINVKKEILKRYPNSYIDNKIDKSFLREIVKNDNSNLKILTSILLPYLRKKINNVVKKNKVVILDIPLLFENNFYKICDFTINVHCNKAKQLKRVFDRNIDNNLYKYLNSIQYNVVKKNKLSDFNINTGYNKYIIRKIIKILIKKLI